MLQELGDLHYLSNILKKLKQNKLNYKPFEKKVCACKEIKINEKLLWSPVECYKLMLEMKMKYDYLNEECIEEVLFEVNRIYLGREEKAVRKVRAGC